jgi:hypothetical protein
VGVSFVRAFLVVAGVLALLTGLALLAGSGSGSGGNLGGLTLVVGGGVLLLAIAFERSRYRGEHAERGLDAPGPGGGEPFDARLEPRFRRTDEVFEDPTSRRRMRVWQDASTGERRYRAEE